MTENRCCVRSAPTTVTRRDVDDELFARLQRHYDDDTIAELTMIIAWEKLVLALQPGVSHPIARVLEAMTDQPHVQPGFREARDTVST